MSQPPEWRDVVGWEGLYQVSDAGQVRSLSRITIDARGRKQPFKGRDLKLVEKKGTGYLQVSLCRDGKQFDHLVHILVAEAFHGPKPSGMEVLHRRPVRSDCRATNLKWGTRQENQIQKVRDGNHTKAGRTHCPRNHPLAQPNLVSSALRAGHRSCLACARTHAYLRRHDGDFQAVSDQYYWQIAA